MFDEINFAYSLSNENTGSQDPCKLGIHVYPTFATLPKHALKSKRVTRTRRFAADLNRQSESIMVLQDNTSVTLTSVLACFQMGLRSILYFFNARYLGSLKKGS